MAFGEKVRKSYHSSFLIHLRTMPRTINWKSVHRLFLSSILLVPSKDIASSKALTYSISNLEHHSKHSWGGSDHCGTILLYQCYTDMHQYIVLIVSSVCFQIVEIKNTSVREQHFQYNTPYSFKVTFFATDIVNVLYLFLYQWYL